jgi:hypothetical protein
MKRGAGFLAMVLCLAGSVWAGDVALRSVTTTEGARGRRADAGRFEGRRGGEYAGGYSGWRPAADEGRPISC